MAFRTSSAVIAITQILFLSRVAHGYPSLLHGLHERQINVNQLKQSYDYIVVGGGQSGLVIANRLSEDSSKTVLVIEYGVIDSNPSQVEPGSAVQYPARDMFNLSSVPQPGLNNAAGTVYAAAVVGGGSTVNGMLFDRGSAEDYDNWEKLSNPGWGWSGLLPYFKKATTFNPPDPQIAAEYGITYDIPSAWGTTGPIQVSFPTWQWPGIKNQFKAWSEVGVQTQIEGASGTAYGAIWFPDAMSPDRRRSYAVNGYYNPASTRSNFQLLTNYRVNEVLFDSAKRAESVRIQQRGTSNGAQTITVKANKEIILCAGWLHTPQILQRSGVGPQSLLQSAGINVVVDLPGVGSNLQDHPATQLGVYYMRDVNPNPASMYTNSTFIAWAQQQWNNGRKGPSGMGVGNAAAMIPLPTFNSNYQATINKFRSQTASQYLPATYTAANVRGFTAQRDILLASFASTKNAIIEIPFSGSGSTSLVLEKPVSRGTVRIKTSDRYAEPDVDYNALINPVDLDNAVAMLKFARRWMQAPSNQALGPVEMTPGTSVQTDQQIADAIKKGMGASTAHACCTSAMQPRDLGGVVGPDLLVYGVTGLSVGDGSIMPLIPATHICQTIYAIAEKAADLIKARA